MTGVKGEKGIDDTLCYSLTRPWSREKKIKGNTGGVWMEVGDGVKENK